MCQATLLNFIGTVRGQLSRPYSAYFYEKTPHSGGKKPPFRWISSPKGGCRPFPTPHLGGRANPFGLDFCEARLADCLVIALITLVKVRIRRHNITFALYKPKGFIVQAMHDVLYLCERVCIDITKVLTSLVFNNNLIFRIPASQSEKIDFLHFSGDDLFRVLCYLSHCLSSFEGACVSNCDVAVPTSANI